MAKSYADYSAYETIKNAKGMTDYAVAKESGVTTATLTSWKQGAYTPKVDKLLKIAEVLGVSLDELLTIEKE
jgi:transcriptional regulator with XRE-family HTH domain